MSFTAMLSLLVLLFFSFINFFIRTCFHYFFLSFALISFFLFSVFLSLFLFSFACPLKLLKEFMGLNLSRKQNNSMRISTSRMLEEMTLEDKWKWFGRAGICARLHSWFRFHSQTFTGLQSFFKGFQMETTTNQFRNSQSYWTNENYSIVI